MQDRILVEKSKLPSPKRCDYHFQLLRSSSTRTVTRERSALEDILATPRFEEATCDLKSCQCKNVSRMWKLSTLTRRTAMSASYSRARALRLTSCARDSYGSLSFRKRGLQDARVLPTFAATAEHHGRHPDKRCHQHWRLRITCRYLLVGFRPVPHRQAHR
jgi:hypothetical protein